MDYPATGTTWEDKKLNVALIQANIHWNDYNASFDHYRALLSSAQLSDVDLILFPEMFASGFSLLTGDSAKECFHAGLAFLKECSQAYDSYCAGSLPKPIDDDERCLNSIQISNRKGELVGEYAKIHLFSFANEDRKAIPGKALYVLQIEEVRIGFFVCYDLRFPQAFASLAEEVDAYAVVANWPASRREHWDTLLKARAIENQAYVMGVNRVGEGGGIQYSGGTSFISPQGQVEGVTDNTEGVLVASISVEEVRSYRASFPTLRDRCPESYRLD